MNYAGFLKTLRGSKEFQFVGEVLIIRDYHTGEEFQLDLSRMTEDVFEELAIEADDEYEDGYEDEY